MTHDLDEIAAGLSAMERRVLLAHRQSVWFSDYHDGASSNAGRALRKAGLLKWHPNPRVTADTLTPLGLAVRALLSKDKNNG